MADMNITAAQYTINPDDGQIDMVKATIDGIEMFVSMSSSNRHYAEIMRQVAAGTLTIQDASE